MRKYFFAAVALFIGIYLVDNHKGSYAASGFTYYWTPGAGDTVTATKMKANYDTIKNWGSRTADSINACPRLTNFTDHNTTLFKWMQIDTLDSAVYPKGVKAPLFDATQIKASSLSTLDSVYTPKGVKAAMIDANVAAFDSIKFASGWLRLDTGSQLCTLNAGANVTVSDSFCTLRWQRLGNFVSASLEGNSGTITATTSDSGSSVQIRSYPAIIVPSTLTGDPVYVPIGIYGSVSTAILWFDTMSGAVYIIGMNSVGSYSFTRTCFNYYLK